MKEDEYIFSQQHSLIRAAINVLYLCYDNKVAERARNDLYQESERMYAEMEKKKMVTP